jgi:hypothetical protein
MWRGKLRSSAFTAEAQRAPSLHREVFVITAETPKASRFEGLGAVRVRSSFHQVPEEAENAELSVLCLLRNLTERRPTQKCRHAALKVSAVISTLLRVTSAFL